MSETGARWVILTELAHEDEARLLAGRLEAEGIPARLSPDFQSDFYGRGSSVLLGKRIGVYVREDRLAQAEQVVRALED